MTLNDQIIAYLTVNKIAFATGDYSTGQPEGQADQVLAWNATKLGSQPSTTQLSDAYTTWQTAQATLASGRAAFSTAINGGLALTSTGTPALNATYSVTPEACANITGLVAGIVAGMGLPAGGEYLDQSGNPHTFNATQFTAFARAVENFVASCDIALATIEKGGTATWPSNAVTIP